MKKFSRIIILVLLLIGAIANICLSSYIEHQKVLNEQKSADTIEECFLGDGGCATVQTSIYATNFGFTTQWFALSNPLLGIYVYSLFSVLFAYFLLRAFFGDMHTKLISRQAMYALIWGNVVGALFSSWLLIVQFFIIDATCKYCIWVDSIQIVTAIVLLLFGKELLK
ncbi:MAG TPA: vitamin K epoxide reductase family protein [Acidobacteriota bacterium]|nr:vitamin K epoxide reductase family protein [Acidobacteriota bacterium]